MVNQNEERIKKLYEQVGLTVINKGAPDFLIFQRDQHGHMENIKFVEVKRDVSDKLKPEQELWREALETLFCDYRLITPRGKLVETEYAKLTCRLCKKEYHEPKNILLAELRRMKGTAKNIIVW